MKTLKFLIKANSILTLSQIDNDTFVTLMPQKPSKHKLEASQQAQELIDEVEK